MRILLTGVFLVTTVSVAGAAQRPNILLAISDDQSWMHTSFAGAKGVSTPAFDRVAREGAFFVHAHTACPSCAPSRSAILTGRPIWQLEEAGVLFGILPKKFDLFPQQLQADGYEIAATGKTWGPGSWQKGGWKSSPFGQHFDKRKLADKVTGRSNNDYAGNFADFLKARDADKPFFFWYGASEPHQSYDVGRWKSAGKKLADADLPGCLPDNETTRGEILDYCLEIEHFDQHLARMLTALEAVGELDNTLIIVTSDHGNPLPRSKCNLYDSGTRVPLAIRWPGKIAAGQKRNEFANLIDLAPTILEAADIAPSKATGHGQSLLPLLTGTAKLEDIIPRSYTVTAFERHTICRRDGLGYPMRALRTAEWSYIHNYEPDRWPAGDPDFVSSHQGFFGDCDRGSSKSFMLAHQNDANMLRYFQLAFGRRPSEELYDLKNDPAELHNLAGKPEYAEQKQRLAEQLRGHLTLSFDPRVRNLSPWDHYPFVDERIFRDPNWKTRGRTAELP